VAEAKNLDIPPERFEVSEPAFKQYKKFMKSVIKLDKNFTLYIHGRKDMVDRGFDDDRGLNFYKLYFDNEE
jgi:hypothetical protein